jgi:hypothetical protein
MCIDESIPPSESAGRFCPVYNNPMIIDTPNAKKLQKIGKYNMEYYNSLLPSLDKAIQSSPFNQ